MVASAALWVHYRDPGNSQFCSSGSGCDVVRQSPLSGFFQGIVPLPLVGVAAYLIVLGVSCRVGNLPEATARGRGVRLLWQRPSLTLFTVAGAGGAFALPLLAYQAFSLGTYCWLCVVVDASAIITAAGSFVLARSGSAGDRAKSPLFAPAWLLVGGLLAALPVGWHALSPEPPAPTALRALFVPNKVNVIEFADFQCPYCRRLHGVLTKVLQEYGNRVHFRRLHRPLPSHSMAELAARAALCAERAGQGEAMAHELFSMQLNPRSIRKAAHRLGLDLDELDQCMTSTDIEAVLERQAALLPDEELEGLPTTYVDSQKIVGAATAARLRDAIHRAERVEPGNDMSAGLLGLWGAALAFVLYFGRRRNAGLAGPDGSPSGRAKTPNATGP